MGVGIYYHGLSKAETKLKLEFLLRYHPPTFIPIFQNNCLPSRHGMPRMETWTQFATIFSGLALLAPASFGAVPGPGEVCSKR